MISYIGSKRRSSLCKLSRLFLSAVICAIALAACDSASDQKNDANWPPVIGEKYVLGEGTKNTVCATDLEAVNTAIEAAAKNDNDGFKQALAPSYAPLTTGTQILVLNYDMFKGIADLRVRSGDYQGQRVYCIVGNENRAFIARHA